MKYATRYIGRSRNYHIMKDETDGRGSRRSTVNLRVFSCNNYLVDSGVFVVAVSDAQKICDRMIAFGDLGLINAQHHNVGRAEKKHEYIIIPSSRTETCPVKCNTIFSLMAITNKLSYLRI